MAAGLIKRLCKPFFKALIALPLILFVKTSPEPSPSFPEADLQCLISAVWHEARGEPVKGKRAVLDVVIHRAAKSGKSYCEVVAAPKQFPWFKKKGLVEVNSETRKHYNEAVENGRVLKDERFVYFNGVRPYGHSCVRIGKHTFCKE